MSKKYNASMVVGSYTDKHGEKKLNRRQIGTLEVLDDGKMRMFLDKSINLAAAINLDKAGNIVPGDKVFVSFFEDKPDDQNYNRW